ncbi:unnamed protein product [Agarophyton chilense]
MPPLPLPFHPPPSESIPTSAAAPVRATSPSKKEGRRPKFTPEDDLIIAREVSAAKAHIAGYGEIQNSFGQAAAKANVNTQLSQNVSAKSIPDRYKKIQDTFKQRDAANRRLSGVCGKIE